MDADLSSLVGLTGRGEFTVERSHTTNAFGEQDDPPGLPAAADADESESIRVFGTPALLAWVEFTGRESLHGRLPDGTGTAGEWAEITHRRAVPEGARLVAETEVVAVDGPRLTLEGAVRRPRDGDGGDGSGGAVVGTVETRFRIVDRAAFRARVE